MTLAIILVLMVLPLQDCAPFQNPGTAQYLPVSDIDMEYPKGYSHRPIMEFYTSLSCAPCMENGEPSTTMVWEQNGYTDEQPFTFIVFHMTNGGDHDDPLVTDEGIERYGEYNVIGTPDIYVDAGYRHPGTSMSEIESAIDESGSRTDDGITTHFRPVDVFVWQLFTGDGFDVKVRVVYNGESSYLPSLSDPTPMADDIHGSLDVFMVEDQVWAYSSDLGHNVTAHNVFRGYAAHAEEVVLLRDQTFEKTYHWDIPTGLEVPIDPLQISPIVAIFDTQDTSSGGSESKPGNPRGVGSATPLSTKYDTKGEAPEIITIDEKQLDKIAEITLELSDAQGVDSAFITYNYESEDYNGTWQMVQVELEPGNDVVGKASVPLKGSKPLYYSVISFDGNWTQGKSEAFKFSPVAEESVEEGSFPTGVVFGLLVIILLGAAFMFRNNPVISSLPGMKTMNRMMAKPKSSGIMDAKFADASIEEMEDAAQSKETKEEEPVPDDGTEQSDKEQGSKKKTSQKKA